MATRIYNTVEVTLQDDTDVVLKPLPIGRLRRFMKAWEGFSEVTNDYEGFNVFINCTGIALEDNFRGRFDSLKATGDRAEQGEFLSPEYKEYLEDTLDLDTIYKVLEVCGGINLNDPKLLAALEEAAAESE